jgi:N-acetylglucosamine kinase-like BadF-type ATPase
MKKYLALDAGGTKVAAILYNENFHIIRTAVSGSLRENTTSGDLIEKHISEIIAQLGLTGGDYIVRISGVCEGSLIDGIRSFCTVGELNMTGEFDIGLCAANIFGDGLLALSGTGATLFGKYQDKCFATGGYGASVSDEGSGYWTARQAFLAAIADDEKRGPKTVLTDLISEHFGFNRSKLGAAIFTIYGQKNLSAVACVARCAPLVTDAAKMGDKVALKILMRTGEVLGLQLLHVIRKYGIPSSVPAAISGNNWRGDRIIFDEFRKILLNQAPEREIIIPKFEPIIGVILKHYHGLHGEITEEFEQQLLSEYKDYTFDIDKPKQRK